MTASYRAELARAQAGLLAALVADAPLPSGFDPVRVRVQVLALAAKRRTDSAGAAVAAPVRPRWRALLARGHAPGQ